MNRRVYGLESESRATVQDVCGGVVDLRALVDRICRAWEVRRSRCGKKRTEMSFGAREARADQFRAGGRQPEVCEMALRSLAFDPKEITLWFSVRIQMFCSHRML